MTAETMTVTQKETLEAMQVLLSAGVPVLLWGEPGTGKTATVERYAVEAGWSMEPLIASLHDPTDFSGLPMRNGSAVVYAPPEWACRVAENAGVSLVFLDEINTATAATQNALMRVVQEHRVGYLHLGERVRFVAAANPPEQNSGAWDLSAPLANRFAHLDWPLRLEEWKAGYLGGWPKLIPLHIDIAAVGEHDVARHREQQSEFLTRRPQLLCDVPDASASPRGWPSPRSWERLAYCTALAETADAGDATRALITVGRRCGVPRLPREPRPARPRPPARGPRPIRGARAHRPATRRAQRRRRRRRRTTRPLARRVQGLHRRRACGRRRRSRRHCDATGQAQAPHREAARRL